MTVHATCIARRLGRDWAGVLLSGRSGAGKSDLALRALEAGWRLVADDYAVVWRSGEGLYARAPDRIADRIEARGIGILPVERLALVRVRLVAACETGTLERLPEPEAAELCGVKLPGVRLNALQDSALAKLERALTTRALPGAAGSAYLGRLRAAEPGPSRPPAQAEAQLSGPQQGAEAR